MGFYSYSAPLKSKIQALCQRRKPSPLFPNGDSLPFSSPLLLAPMASIGNAPFRLLMQELGSGGSVSEFVSCNGLTHGNRRTSEMLRIHPEEKNVGIQIFGSDQEKMAEAAKIAQEGSPQGRQPDFIDINLGCPVRKIVGKGAGAALLKDPSTLGNYLETIKKVLRIPLTIKIRTGWDTSGINAHEICHIAKECGVSLVSVHGRTRTQGYEGKADWNYIEWLTTQTPLPLIGNGDLHLPHQVRNRLKTTECSGLMIARGCLRNPFIFLESYRTEQEDTNRDLSFMASDYWEVLKRYHMYVLQFFDREPVQIVQLRKLIMWFASGFPGASRFRSGLFQTTMDLQGLMTYAEDYFIPLGCREKSIDYNQDFMMSGHG